MSPKQLAVQHSYLLFSIRKKWISPQQPHPSVHPPIISRLLGEGLVSARKEDDPNSKLGNGQRGETNSSVCILGSVAKCHSPGIPTVLRAVKEVFDTRWLHYKGPILSRYWKSAIGYTYKSVYIIAKVRKELTCAAVGSVYGSLDDSDTDDLPPGHLSPR
eukprot:1194328-Prorocentrum_minimum.AAC.3